jgi:superfamily II DNA helicase RecQ
VRAPLEDLLESVQGFLADDADGAGIIYCFKTQDCENISHFLCERGVRAAVYHSKGTSKAQSLENWQTGKIPVMVATVRK